MPPIPEAITLDFFNTLAFHRDGRGRGRLLIEYLERHGLSPAPWDHDVLYDVFAFHQADYSPSAPEAEKTAYFAALAGRVLDRVGIIASPTEAARHAKGLWAVIGPSGFDVFPDALEALAALQARGIPLAVVSNWQSGLSHFCTELGLSPFFEHVLSSADVGIEKPDARIFLDACDRLGTSPEHTLHVGDTHFDDYVGATSAGLQAVLIDRTNQADKSIRAVHTLTEILDIVAGPGMNSFRPGHITRVCF